MGILVKKRQQGGSIYSNPEYIKFHALLSSGGAKGSGSSNRNYVKPDRGSRTSSTASTDEKLDGGIESDIAYYKAMQMKNAKAIKDGLEDIDFDDSSEYKALLEEKHYIETVMQPQMKSMASLYKSTRNRFDTKDANDGLAILQGEAIVKFVAQNEKGEQYHDYKLIPEKTLLENPEGYEVLTAGEVSNLRSNNMRFSGFTALGKKAMLLIENGYGSKSFNKELKGELSRIGYIKNKVGLQTTKDKKILDFLHMPFEETGLVTKTNATNVRSIYESLINNNNTNLNNYLRNNAIKSLQKQIFSGEIKVDDKTNMNMLIHNKAASMLAMTLKQSVMVDAAKEAKENSSNSSSKKERSIFTGNISVAKLLGNKKKFLEVDFVNDKDRELSSLINKVPAAHIAKDDELILEGFEKTAPLNSDGDATAPRTLYNNTFINAVLGGGETKVTTADGHDILKQVDDNDENYITIAPRPKMHMILAPVETDEYGKEYVNFKNEFTPLVIKAISNTYDRLSKEEHLTAEDVASGSIEAVNKVQQIAKEEMSKLVKGKSGKIPEIKISIMLDVVYESDRNTRDYDYKIPFTPADKTYLKAAIDTPFDFSDFTAKTKAFAPISSSFWARMQASKNAFDERFMFDYTPDAWEAALKKSGKVSPLNISGITDSESARRYAEQKKKDGGKLISLEEITELLFN